VERLWSLRRARVLPERLLEALREWSEGGMVSLAKLDKLTMQSPLGRIVAVGLVNRARGREIVKETIEDTGRYVVHQLERFLNTLGTIAAITPLLGLLGTVFGMIEVFTVISVQGTGDAEQLAGGISKALITTAAGLTVAIPTLLFYRYFRGKVDALVLHMELEVMRLVDLIHAGGQEERE
jgi:biopolymer transport protein ExbB